MEQIIPIISGPFGALVLAVGTLVWIGQRLVPMLEKYLSKQNSNLEHLISALEKTVAAHEEDRVLFKTTLEKLSEQLNHIEADIIEIRHNIATSKR